jgi:hypothetical protein
MARNWFRDDNFTFLIVFSVNVCKGIMDGWQKAEAPLDKGNSRRPAAMVKQFASRGGRNSECRTAGSSRALLKKNRATMIGMVQI